MKMVVGKHTFISKLDNGIYRHKISLMQIKYFLYIVFYDVVNLCCCYWWWHLV